MVFQNAPNGKGKGLNWWAKNRYSDNGVEYTWRYADQSRNRHRRRTRRRSRALSNVCSSCARRRLPRNSRQNQGNHQGGNPSRRKIYSTPRTAQSRIALQEATENTSSLQQMWLHPQWRNATKEMPVMRSWSELFPDIMWNILEMKNTPIGVFFYTQ